VIREKIQEAISLELDMIGNTYLDKETGIKSNSKTGLQAALKRYYLKIPDHSYLSNRYVLHMINIKTKEMV
jgi:hypothetical protein